MEIPHSIMYPNEGRRIKMERAFIQPEVEIVMIESEDIITTSGDIILPDQPLN